MKKTQIVVDTNFLAYRAFHTFGGDKGLLYQGKPTGITFGIMRDIKTLTETFNTPQIVFCFDYGKLCKRIDIFPGYKLKRRREKEDADQKEKYVAIRKEVSFIRDKLLPDLGIKNIFFEDGYEADDMIACAIWNGAENIIVSADKDLYQLLSPKVMMWNPNNKKMLTHTGFKSEFKIDPIDWIKVKALAGCSTDGIPGADGIGEKKAIAFFNETMNKETASWEKCKRWTRSEEYERNLKLVSLPFPGLNPDKYIPQTQKAIEHSVWRRMSQKLGMKSFLAKN